MRFVYVFFCSELQCRDVPRIDGPKILHCMQHPLFFHVSDVFLFHDWSVFAPRNFELLVYSCWLFGFFFCCVSFYSSISLECIEVVFLHRCCFFLHLPLFQYHHFLWHCVLMVSHIFNSFCCNTLCVFPLLCFKLLFASDFLPCFDGSSGLCCRHLWQRDGTDIARDCVQGT